MNILALDYGKRRIGLAWMQQGLDVVLPFGSIHNDEKDAGLSELASLITTEKIDQLVIGLPLGLDGKENINTDAVRAFAKKITAANNIPIEFIDERYTSHEADRMEDIGVSRDERAAMIILRAYASNNARSS